MTPASADFDEGKEVGVCNQPRRADTSDQTAFSWISSHTAQDAAFLSWVDHGHAISERTGTRCSPGIFFHHSKCDCCRQGALLPWMDLAVIPAPPPIELASFLSMEKKKRRKNYVLCRLPPSVDDSSHMLTRIHQIDYVFVVFGGAAAYPDDDMNKILWMAQAAGDAAPRLLTDHGEFRIDSDASLALHRSLLYRCSARAGGCAIGVSLCIQAFLLPLRRFSPRYALLQMVGICLLSRRVASSLLLQGNARLGVMTACERQRLGKKTFSFCM
jgi:hypothetical protein